MFCLFFLSYSDALLVSKRLIFHDNNKRAFVILDLVHCDLWGLTPVAGYSDFVIFVDDFSRFSWFYTLRRESDFYDVLLRFKAFVENEFSKSIKFFVVTMVPIHE